MAGELRGRRRGATRWAVTRLAARPWRQRIDQISNLQNWQTGHNYQDGCTYKATITGRSGKRIRVVDRPPSVSDVAARMAGPQLRVPVASSSAGECTLGQEAVGHRGRTKSLVSCGSARAARPWLSR